MKMKETKNKVYSLFKDNFNTTLKFSSFISLYLIVIYFILFLLLNYINMSNLTGVIIVYIVVYIFTILITPYFYSYYANNGLLCAKDPHLNKEMINVASFLGTKKIGKMKPYRNAQGIFIKLLIAYLISIFSNVIILIVAMMIGYCFKDESGIYGFIKAVEALDDSLTFYQDFYNLVGKFNSSLRIVTGISSFISVSFGFYYFLHTFARSFLNYLYLNPMDNMPSRYISKMIKKALKADSSDYNKTYYYIMWPYYLITFLLFTSSYLLLFFTLKDLSVVSISLTSMIIVIFILLPFLPIVLNLNNLKREELIPLFIDEIGVEINHILDSAKKSKRFSESELNELDRQVKKSQESYDKLLKELKEKKKEEDSKNNEDKEKKD